MTTSFDIDATLEHGVENFANAPPISTLPSEDDETWARLIIAVCSWVDHSNEGAVLEF